MALRTYFNPEKRHLILISRGYVIGEGQTGTYHMGNKQNIYETRKAAG
jgi:hypothetical protein